MKDEILSQIRPFVFHDVAVKVSGMLDQYRSQIEETNERRFAGPSLQDQIDHLTKALAMVAKVPPSAEGAMMAKDISQEAMSAIQANNG